MTHVALWINCRVVGMTLFKVRIVSEFVASSASRSGNDGCVCDLTFLPSPFIDYLINTNGLYCSVETSLKGMTRKTQV